MYVRIEATTSAGSVRFLVYDRYASCQNEKSFLFEMGVFVADLRVLVLVLVKNPHNTIDTEKKQRRICVWDSG
jgi:hypothetical protein